MLLVPETEAPVPVEIGLEVASTTAASSTSQAVPRWLNFVLRIDDWFTSFSPVKVHLRDLAAWIYDFAFRWLLELVLDREQKVLRHHLQGLSHFVQIAFLLCGVDTGRGL